MQIISEIDELIELKCSGAR